MIPKNLGELLSISARRYAHRVAIVFGQKNITYKALDDLTTQIAAGLVNLGIRKQDRVAIFLDNCPEFVISYFAILKAGAVVVPINYMFKIEEAKFILEDSQAVCLIVSRAYLDMAEELRLRVDSLKYIISTVKIKEEVIDFSIIQKDNRKIGIDEISPDPNDLAIILYTSGTTGFPKGAMLSQYNLISNAIDSAYAIEATSKDTFICILPLFHSFAATVCMNLPLAVGAKIVIMKSVRPFKRIIRALRRNRVTIFVGVPSIYNILKSIKLPRIITPFFKLLNPVKICISGAAALPIETLKGFEKKFRIPLLEGYGLTEASPVVTLNPLKGIHKPGSIGTVLSKNIAVRIVDDKNHPLGAERIGELLVKGPNVMQGYYKQPEAAVIGVFDAYKGEVPKGFIVPKEDEFITEHEIIQYLRERLAPYKIPKYIEFKASLPKNTTGKILKRILKNEEDTQRR